nr:hypothetical protein [uncultured Emticicia sp.]
MLDKNAWFHTKAGAKQNVIATPIAGQRVAKDIFASVLLGLVLVCIS